VERHVYPKSNANESILVDKSETNNDEDVSLKVEMLEKVLEAIQLKKQALKEEFEKDLLNQDSDWEDEHNELADAKQSFPNYRKKLHKKIKKCKRASKAHCESPINDNVLNSSLLNLAHESDYALAMKSKIENLEQRLQCLRTKCSQTELVTNNETDKQEPEKEKLLSQKIFQEVASIRDQLNLLHNKLQILELANSQKQPIKEANSSISRKKPVSKDLVENHSKSSGVKEIKELDYGQCIIFENGDEMRKGSDNTIVSS
jgi:hypothetical protein